MSITVAILDDRQLFREGVKLLLSTQIDLKVVGEASDPAQGYELVCNAKPQVVVVSEELNGVGGLATAREIVRREPEARVLLAAVSSSADSARRALTAGARGYVLKTQASADLFEAIRVVARGEVYLPPEIAAQATNWRHDGNGSGNGHRNGHRFSADHIAEPLDVLSARERQVFELLVRGHTNGSIAGLLGISAKTVDTHRTKVMRKIGVHSVVDLVRFAARNQLSLD
ncbi:MAG: response regulator containing a CheY-like receiver domain and an DNA-binding domain [Myxococcales bacterium]|nr:response regulator containing a CheY-like receiver domain and an DNA-binding domain [Myxococcales bacterium]